MGKKIFLALAALAAVLVLALVLAPAPIDPAPYRPEPGSALTGPLAPNHDLRAAEILAASEVRGPEDVAVDADGRIYAGTEDGRIVRLTPADGGSHRLETVAETGGRPLGLDFDPAGNLIIADGVRGLLKLDVGGGVAGRVETLATGSAGLPFAFTDDLDVATDGRIYFSDASSRFGPDSYLYDLLEARPHGRLLRHDPATGKTEVLLDGLYFANGVALSENEDFVLVNETYRYRITRYWLAGPAAGTSEVFVDRLPGFPDGVSANRRGTFWVALFTVRNPMMDRLHPRPFLKGLLSKLPRFLWPVPEPYGLVLALDEEGRVRRSLHDPGGERVLEVTSAEEAGGFLYLGTLKHDRIARLAL